MADREFLVFSEDTELGDALRRYFCYVKQSQCSSVTYCQIGKNINNKDYFLLVLDLTGSKENNFKESNQKNFIDYILKLEKEKLPKTLILNPEKSLDNYVKFLGDFHLLLFTEIFYDYLPQMRISNS
jgi:hypothetical protein